MRMTRTLLLCTVAVAWGCTGDPVEGSPASGTSTAGADSTVDGGGPQTVTTVDSAEEGAGDATTGKADGDPTDADADDGMTEGGSIGSGGATSTSGTTASDSSSDGSSGDTASATGTGSSAGTTGGSSGGASSSEGTGTTGGPTCPPSVDACDGCLGEFCCAELLACEDDVDCTCWRECVAGGGNQMDCNPMCNGMSATFNSLRECQEMHCSGDCSM